MSFRDGPFNDLKVPLTWTAAVALVVAIVAGLALLLSDRRETLQTQAYGAGRKVFDLADKPVADAVSTPGQWFSGIGDAVRDYLAAGAQNARLRQEVADLRAWRDRAIALEDANTRYQAILGLKTDPPIPMVTARVVLDSRGPFADTRLANAGSEKGVEVGNPVMNERGLVGRVVGVTSGASRILLLNDAASRTPVLVDRTDARAILLGDGGSNPRLAYLRGVAPVKAGDRILTSGDGGVFPRGLPVGVAAKGLDGQWRVRLYADLTGIDFVRVLEFQDFTKLVDQKALDRQQMPPPVVGLKPKPKTVKVPAQGAAAPPPPQAARSGTPDARPAAPRAAQAKPAASPPAASRPAPAGAGGAVKLKPPPTPLVVSPARIKPRAEGGGPAALPPTGARPPKLTVAPKPASPPAAAARTGDAQ